MTRIERLLPLQAAQKQPDDQHRDVGERGSQVRLLEHQQHGQANQQEGLEDIAPGKLPARQVGEVSRHGDDQHQLDPFGWLEVDPARKLDPAPRRP